jgi:hypothetical protein
MKPPQAWPSPAALPLRSRSLPRARRLITLILLLLVVTVTLGRNWDAMWHATHVFETFYSPPHIFILLMTSVTTLIVLALICSPALRRCFGAGFQVPSVPFMVPGPLFLLGSGFALLGIGGLVLDNIWHTAFGLDETAWSVPHALMGWALWLAILGCVASWLELGAQRHLSYISAFVFGFLILSFSASPFLGPLNKNATPSIVEAIAAIPTFKAQPSAAHTFRIYLLWDLNRTNPWLAPVGALWASVALTLVRRLAPRPWLFVAIILVWSLLVTLAERSTARWLDTFQLVSNHPAAWLPFPLLPAALALIIADRAGIARDWGWAIAGAVFGGCMFAIWHTDARGLLMPVLTTLAMPLGARLGSWLASVVEHPTELPAKLLVVLCAIIPLCTGALDIYMRGHTP